MKRKTTSWTRLICFVLSVLFVCSMPKLAYSQSEDKLVTFRTNIQPGNDITFGVAANGTVTVEGVTSGFWMNSSDCTYTVGADQNITLKGDITKLYMDNAEITEIDVSKASSLSYMSITKNHLKKLDVSLNTLLEYLYVQDNDLEELLLCSGGLISRVYCIHNKIKGDNMLRLVESLSDRTTSNVSGELGFIDIDEGALEENECSKSLVQEAKSKNWNIKAFDQGNYIFYEGSDGGGSTSLDQTVVMKTTLKVGDAFPMSLEPLSALTYTGLEVIKDTTNDGETYKVLSQDITIRGKVKSIDVSRCNLITLSTRNNPEIEVINCANNPLRRLNLTENEALSKLNCSNTELNSLNLSQNLKLKELDCHGNMLKELNLIHNVELEKVICYDNKIKSLGADLLVENLVNRSEKSIPGKIVLLAPKSGNEENVFYQRQVSLIKNKNWIVQAQKEGATIAYEGQEDPYILFTTAKEIGDVMRLKIASENNVEIEGLSGIWCNDEYIEFTVEKKNIKLIGEIYQLQCFSNLITEIDFTHAAFLQKVDCSDNLLSGEKMDRLIQSLPQRPMDAMGEVTVFDASKEKENNNCTKKQSYDARQRGWKTMQYISGEGYRPYEGSDDEEPPVHTNNIIKFKTDKAVDSVIEMVVRTSKENPSVKVEGLVPESEFGNAVPVRCTVVSQEFSIQGEIIDLDCRFCDIVEIDLTDCHSLAYLNCGVNKIKSLNLTSLRALEDLVCFNNQIEMLDLSGNPRLEWLHCNNNEINTQGFQTILNTLPDRKYNEHPGTVVYYNEWNTELEEHNKATKKQVKEVGEKNWKMLKVVGEDAGLLQYEDYLHNQEIAYMGWTAFVDPYRQTVEVYGAPELQIISLVDMTGLIVRSAQADVDGHVSLDLQGLCPGKYIVVVESEAQSIIF